MKRWTLVSPDKSVMVFKKKDRRRSVFGVGLYSQTVHVQDLICQYTLHNCRHTPALDKLKFAQTFEQHTGQLVRLVWSHLSTQPLWKACLEVSSRTSLASS